jgi:pyruvate, water dikinase
MFMKSILNFTEITKKDVELAGGKGASLGEMTNHGIPVPPGFVILSTAFDKFIAETGMNAEIDAALDDVDHQKMHTVEDVSERIRSIIMNVPMPEDLAKEIYDHFEKLDAKLVAVRSSATAEDSSAAAWAGQLDTFLNTNKETLIENVRKCWASLFTPRAIFYRFEKELHKQYISVAVVIQKMVESEISGIAFSVHPVTQDRNQLIIEAGLGLGEAVVSGQITPDSYVVDKQDYTIIDINVSEQNKKLVLGSSGSGSDWVDITDGGEQKLTGKEIIELSKLVVLIEEHYKFPCDIEWAVMKGKFYVTQSRPITTL